MAERQSTKSTDQVLEESLVSLGLDPEPFLHLQAIQDRRLREYMVTFDLSSSVLDDQNIVFWAPLGGGKSALRIYLMQNCWSMLGSTHPLPVYVTPQQPSDLVVESETGLLEFLLGSIVTSLSVGLFYQPFRLLDLSERQRRFLGCCLRSYLPVAPEYLLQGIREDRSVVVNALVANYRLDLSMPKSAQIRIFADFLAGAAVGAPYRPGTAEFLESVLEELIELICGPLRFRSVFLLVDAVDTFSGFSVVYCEVARWLYQLGELVRPRSRLWIKAFLASDIRASVECLLSNRPESLSIAGHYPIHWTQERLMEMLRMRIQAASHNRLSTFEAFTGLGFVEKLEKLLVDSVSPRPRDVLWLMQQTLRQYWLRTSGAGGYIERIDLDKALKAVELEFCKNQSSPFWLD